MKPSWYSIKAAADTADIAIRGIVGDPKEWGGTGDAAQFAADLKPAKAAKIVNITIHSPGGSVFEGIAIANQLAALPGRKIMTVEGLAASMASYLLTAADEVRIPANAYVMVHNPWAVAVGDVNTMRESANQLDMLRSDMADAYAGMTKKPKADMITLMDNETWMNGATAVEQGFAHTLLEPRQLAALAPDARALFDTIGIRNMPSEISSTPPVATDPAPAPAAPAPEKEPDATTPAPSTEEAKPEETEPTATWLQKAVAALTGARKAKEERDSATAQLTEVQATLAARDAEITTLKTRITALEQDTAVIAQLRAELATSSTAAETKAATIVASLGIAPDDAPAAKPDESSILDRFNAITDPAERTRFYNEHRADLFKFVNA